MLTNMPPAWLLPSDLNTCFRTPLEGCDPLGFMGYLYVRFSLLYSNPVVFVIEPFGWFWIYDGNKSEQSNNFPLAITLPFGTLSLRGEWMCWDLSMSLVARCKKQIKARIQMQNKWLLSLVLVLQPEGFPRLCVTLYGEQTTLLFLLF